MKSIKNLAVRSFFGFVAATAIVMLPIAASAQDQAPAATQPAPAQIEGLSRQPTPAAAAALFDPNDSVLLLLDHQTGLFQTVNDIPVADLRRNTVALAKIAELAGIPIIVTASEPNGPNGPIMEELAKVAPNAVNVGRQGRGERLGQR